LPDQTKIYPGHDYIVNNLQFTLDREAGNAAAKCLLAALEQWSGYTHFISTVEVERQINAFFRLDSRQVIRMLKKAFPDMQDEPTEEEVFVKLRALRDRW